MKIVFAGYGADAVPVLGVFAATGATSTASVAAHASPPLVKRVLAAGEMPGYKRLPPTDQPLSLAAFVKASGDAPNAGRMLEHYGFVTGAYENLKGPTPPPPGNSSSSSVTQLGSAAQAAALLATITRRYYTHGPGMGIKLTRFTGTRIPGATAAHFSKGIVNEYNVLFTTGAYFYDEDIFTRGRALTQAQFIRHLHGFYQRVR